MNKFYKAIEEKIKASGYPREISGRGVYNDICDQIEDKENGTYLVLSKFEDDVTFEYHITIQDEGFIAVGNAAEQGYLFLAHFLQMEIVGIGQPCNLREVKSGEAHADANQNGF